MGRAASELIGYGVATSEVSRTLFLPCASHQGKFALGLSVIACHLLGDFVLQNDYMANGKKHSSWICTLHVAVYMIGFTLLVIGGWLTWWQWVAIAVQHWLQDRTTFVAWWMRMMGQTKFMGPPFAPWSLIVVDLSMHLAWLALVVNWLPRLIVFLEMRR